MDKNGKILTGVIGISIAGLIGYAYYKNVEKTILNPDTNPNIEPTLPDIPPTIPDIPTIPTNTLTIQEPSTYSQLILTDFIYSGIPVYDAWYLKIPKNIPVIKYSQIMIRAITEPVDAYWCLQIDYLIENPNAMVTQNNGSYTVGKNQEKNGYNIFVLSVVDNGKRYLWVIG